MGLNSVNLQGNLTRDPILKETKNGKSVANFGLAINEKFGENETTVFVDITVWGKTAEFASEYLTKGSQIIVEGRLSFDAFEDKEGNKRSRVFVTGDRLHFCGSKKSGGGGGRASESGNGSDDEPETTGKSGDDDSEIPF